LISIMFASLVGITSFTLISRSVCLIVYIMVLVKVRTSPLLGTSLAMTSGGGCRWSGCTPFIDLDYGNLQICFDSIECWGLGDLI
jgi:hypothetical protein